MTPMRNDTGSFDSMNPSEVAEATWIRRATERPSLWLAVAVVLTAAHFARLYDGDLALLIDTAGADEVARMVQKRVSPDHTWFIGKGKAEELKQLCLAVDADTVVFDNNLAPAQQYNLEKMLGRTAIDRTAVILDIFGQNAHTLEGKAQVELALLRYRLPRLRRGLSDKQAQQRGGVGGVDGVGSGGSSGSGGSGSSGSGSSGSSGGSGSDGFAAKPTVSISGRNAGLDGSSGICGGGGASGQGSVGHGGSGWLPTLKKQMAKSSSSGSTAVDCLLK